MVIGLKNSLMLSLILFLSFSTVLAQTKPESFELPKVDNTESEALKENEIDKKYSFSIVNKKFNFLSDGSATVQIDIKKKYGDINSLKNSLSKKLNNEMENELLNEYGPGEQRVIKNLKVERSQTDSQELNYSGNYHVLFSKNAILLPELNTYNELFKTHAEPTFVISAQTMPNIEHTYFYKNAFAVGKEPKYCDIQTEWLNAKRSIHYLSDGILVKDTVHLNQREFSEKDLNDEKFKALFGQMKSCFFGNVMQVTFQSRKHLVITNVFEESLVSLPLKERLSKRIEKAIEINACCDKSNGMHIEMIRVLLERNIKEDPSFVPSYQHLSYYYQGKDNLKMALKYLDIALSYEPDFLEGLISKACILCRLNKCDEGKRIINEKVLTKDVNQFSYYAIRGMRTFYSLNNDLLRQKQYYDLLLKKADTNFERSEVFGLLASSALDHRNFKECIDYSKKAIEADEDSSCNHYKLGVCYAAQANYDKAILSMENALSKKDSTEFRVEIAKLNVLKSMDFKIRNDEITIKSLINKSFAICNDWRSSLELLKFFFVVNKKDEAFRAALQATEQFGGDTKTLSGYITQLFNKKDLEYSFFMKRVINNMTNKLDATELAYYIAYELQNNPNEMQSWIKLGLKNLSQLKLKPADEDMVLDINILATRFYLLSTNQTMSSAELLKANEHFEIAKKVQPRSKKVGELDYYVQTANRMLGKDGFLWETRLKLEKNFGIRFPMWMLYWMNG